MAEPLPSVPSPPTGLRLTTPRGRPVRLDWAPSPDEAPDVDPVYEYALFRRNESTGTIVLVKQRAAMSALDLSAPRHTVCTWWTVAINADGVNSDPSDAVTGQRLD